MKSAQLRLTLSFPRLRFGRTGTVFTADTVTPKFSATTCISSSGIRGSGAIGTIDCRDSCGSSVFVCQTRMSCGLSVGTSMTVVLVDMPSALRLRLLGGTLLGPLFDIAEGVRERESENTWYVTSKSSINDCSQNHRGTPFKDKSFPVVRFCVSYVQ